MNQEQRPVEQRRGLRFPFNAAAEVFKENSRESIPARVIELSLLGCFLEISSPLIAQQRLLLKIFHSGEYFETFAKVLYLRPPGAGLVFGDVKPHFRSVLQAWMLAALEKQTKSQHP